MGARKIRFIFIDEIKKNGNDDKEGKDNRITVPTCE